MKPRFVSAVLLLAPLAALHAADIELTETLQAGRLREVDVRTLRKVGGMIRNKAPEPNVPPPAQPAPKAKPSAFRRVKTL